MEQSYKEKYEQALAKAKEQYNYPCMRSCMGILEEIFPELKESEDEKVRKRLIADFGTIGKKEWGGLEVKDILAWLEKQVEERKITHEEICKSYGIPDIGEFSDGYHTFNGLYKQRMILFAVLVKTYKDRAWKSWKHEDGLDCFGGGWFIVGIDTPAGTYTYHYEAKDWDRFDCQILEKAKHWDGHDESDVERLFSLVSNANKDEVIRCLINGMKFYYEDNEEATWGTQKFSMKVKDILSWLEKQEGCEYIKKDWLEHIKQSWYKEGLIDGKYSGGTSKEWTINDAATLKELIDFLENGTAKLQHDLTRYANWLKNQFTPIIERQGEQNRGDRHRSGEGIRYQHP